MQNLSLTEWLIKIRSIHVTEMDFSLERVMEVAGRLNLLKPACPVITVGGTNGKGSCVAGLEAIYKAEGYRTGSFTTPFLFRHNEQVRVLGREAGDDDFCQAYARIEKALGNVTLTPFEFNALAAFEIFQKANLDVWLLEVGLGGRWDAVNVIDADVTLVASIGIDHTEWLGDTREKIAREKAGIFRPGKPAVCGDFDPPQPLIEIAAELKTPLFCQGKDFSFEDKGFSWTWKNHKNHFEKLPKPTLALQNMATVLQAIELLQERLPVTLDSIHRGLSQVTLPGRLQVIPGDIPQVFDVSHNPAAAEWLAKWIRENPIAGKTRAVFSMLADKDIVSTLLVMKKYIDDWYVGPIKETRGASLEKLRNCFHKTKNENVKYFSMIKDAHQEAMQESTSGDRIIVFGSFKTVTEVTFNL